VQPLDEIARPVLEAELQRGRAIDQQVAALGAAGTCSTAS
jgi:hypothetical protein